MTSNLMSRYVVCVIVLGLAGLCIALNWPINLGIDLKGGSILTYEVQKIQTDNEGPIDPGTIQKSEMEEVDSLAVPLAVDIEFGQTWFDAKT